MSAPKLTLLTAEDRTRVQIYLRMVDHLEEVSVAMEQWHEAGQHPEITDEQRAKSAATVEEALKTVNFDTVQDKLPTVEMLHAYALEAILGDLAEIKADIAEIKGQIY